MRDIGFDNNACSDLFSSRYTPDILVEIMETTEERHSFAVEEGCRKRRPQLGWEGYVKRDLKMAEGRRKVERKKPTTGSNGNK